MARGNKIIVSANPRGVFREGVVAAGETFYPGMVVQVDPSVALKSGTHTYKIFSRDADGDHPAGAHWVVLENSLLGLSASDSYAAAERCFLYAPVAGEDINLLIKNLSGTADDHAVGEILMVDTGTGKLIATTGSPEEEVAVLLEAVTDPTADTLAWCQWS